MSLLPKFVGHHILVIWCLISSSHSWLNHRSSSNIIRSQLLTRPKFAGNVHGAADCGWTHKHKSPPLRKQTSLFTRWDVNFDDYEDENDVLPTKHETFEEQRAKMMELNTIEDFEDMGVPYNNPEPLYQGNGPDVTVKQLSRYDLREKIPSYFPEDNDWGEKVPQACTVIDAHYQVWSNGSQVGFGN
jgi:hypothetical protein